MKSTILYKGPSMLTGEPIVVVAVFTNTNRKTGAMVQTYILRDNGESPMANAKSLADAAICGACPHRQGLGGACYVNLGQGPRAVYSAYLRGAYAKGDATAMGNGRMVRLGTYGDPAAVPFEVWSALTAKATGWTGYTHQSRARGFDRRILSLCMISADTAKQADKANASGARTFRVMGKGDTLRAGEIECLSDAKGLTCAECKLCNGAEGKGPSIAIHVHGALAGRFEAKLGRIGTVAV